MGSFEKIPAVKVVGLCDPDPSRVDKAKKRFPGAKTASDLRKMIDDPEIDAVVVATCNHWHCLASIWAMQAGKDVYVEKPLSHTQWEGEQTVAAARKYNRICQVGTQQRSDPMQAKIKDFLHVQKGIGELKSVRVNRYGVRGPIGKRSEQLPKDPAIDFDLWLGPAADKPVFRNAWHYDWHWDWNTGSGEMGNWGVHVLDDVRNVVFQDSVAVPRRILGGGGRVAWNDSGETPNVHVVAFDTGTLPVVIGLSNLTAGPDSNKSPDVPGPGSGYVVIGEGGRLEGQRGSARAFDKDNKVIQEFRGNSGAGHQANFVDAVIKRDPGLLKLLCIDSILLGPVFYAGQAGHRLLGDMNSIKDPAGESVCLTERLQGIEEPLMTLFAKRDMHLAKDHIGRNARLPGSQRLFKATTMRAAVPEELQHLDLSR